MLQRAVFNVLQGPRFFSVLGARSFSAASQHAVQGSETQAELQEFKEQVRAFAQQHVAPLAAKVDHDNDAPMDIWTKMGDFGLLGALGTLPLPARVVVVSVPCPWCVCCSHVTAPPCNLLFLPQQPRHLFVWCFLPLQVSQPPRCDPVSLPRVYVGEKLLNYQTIGTHTTTCSPHVRSTTYTHTCTHTNTPTTLASHPILTLTHTPPSHNSLPPSSLR